MTGGVEEGRHHGGFTCDNKIREEEEAPARVYGNFSRRAEAISLRVVALTDPLRKAKISGCACCSSWWILAVSPSLSWLGNGRGQTRTPGDRQPTLSGRDGVTR
jgi:hypothetical protein